MWGLALALTTSMAVAQTTTSMANPKENKLKLVRGSEVVGADLFNQKGEDLGEINDVLIDENTGEITHGILAIGGWLGIGEKLTPVPWQNIKPSEKATRGYVVDLEKAKLAGAASFEKNKWPDLRGNFGAQNYTYFGLTGKTGMKLVRLSEVDDAKLFDQKGQQIGEIHETLLHPKSGQVAYGVISTGEYTGRDADQRTTVPFDLIRQSKKDTPGYVLDVEKSKLNAATYFKANQWPEFNDRAWNERMYSHYGVDPFWQTPGGS